MSTVAPERRRTRQEQEPLVRHLYEPEQGGAYGPKKTLCGLIRDTRLRSAQPRRPLRDDCVVCFEIARKRWPGKKWWQFWRRDPWA